MEFVEFFELFGDLMMDLYLWIKILYVFFSVVLVGIGFGIVFYLFMVNCSGLVLV